MTDNEEKVMPVEPIRYLRVTAIRPFGAEERWPQRTVSAKKKKPAEKQAADSPCIITPNKVDCKI